MEGCGGERKESPLPRWCSPRRAVAIAVELAWVSLELFLQSLKFPFRDCILLLKGEGVLLSKRNNGLKNPLGGHSLSHRHAQHSTQHTAQHRKEPEERKKDKEVNRKKEGREMSEKGNEWKEKIQGRKGKNTFELEIR